MASTTAKKRQQTSKEEGNELTILCALRNVSSKVVGAVVNLQGGLLCVSSVKFCVYQPSLFQLLYERARARFSIQLISI